MNDSHYLKQRLYYYYFWVMEASEIEKLASVSPKRLEFPQFWIGHIPFVLYFVPQVKPSVIVELGTHSGNSFFAFCQAVKENNLDTKCYAVDTWLGDEHAGFYYEDVYESVEKHRKENYANN